MSFLPLCRIDTVKYWAVLSLREVWNSLLLCADFIILLFILWDNHLKDCSNIVIQNKQSKKGKGPSIFKCDV